MSNKLTTFEQFKMLGNKVKTFVDNSISNLAGLTSTAISELKTGKQDKLIGKEGQIVGFNNAGNVVNVGGPINSNLIDNPNFKVNQRGQTEYTFIDTPIYGPDRWSAYNTTISITNNGISIHANGTSSNIIFQLLDVNIFGKLVTASALLEDGTLISGSNFVMTEDYQDWVITNIASTANGLSISIQIVPDKKIRVLIDGLGRKRDLVAVKLELGDHQTLAHQDSSGNWLLNEIPNYALELAKCQRYQLNLGQQSNNVVGSWWSILPGSAAIFIPTPVEMRDIPTVKYTNLRIVRINSFTIFEHSGVPTMVTKTRNGITIGISVDGIQQGDFGWCDFNNGNLLFDSNL